MVTAKFMTVWSPLISPQLGTTGRKSEKKIHKVLMEGLLKIPFHQVFVYVMLLISEEWFEYSVAPQC